MTEIACNHHCCKGFHIQKHSPCSSSGPIIEWSSTDLSTTRSFKRNYLVASHLKAIPFFSIFYLSKGLKSQANVTIISIVSITLLREVLPRRFTWICPIHDAKSTKLSATASRITQNWALTFFFLWIISIQTTKWTVNTKGRKNPIGTRQHLHHKPIKGNSKQLENHKEGDFSTHQTMP